MRYRRPFGSKLVQTSVESAKSEIHNLILELFNLKSVMTDSSPDFILKPARRQPKMLVEDSSNQKENLELGLWTKQENCKYLQFLLANKEKMISKTSRMQHQFSSFRGSKVFCEMAVHMVTRDRVQCRSHHQKLLIKCRSNSKIVEFICKKVMKNERDFEQNLTGIELLDSYSLLTQPEIASIITALATTKHQSRAQRQKYMESSKDNNEATNQRTNMLPNKGCEQYCTLYSQTAKNSQGTFTRIINQGYQLNTDLLEQLGDLLPLEANRLEATYRCQKESPIQAVELSLNQQHTNSENIISTIISEQKFAEPCKGNSKERLPSSQREVQNRIASIKTSEQLDIQKDQQRLTPLGSLPTQSISMDSLEKHFQVKCSQQVLNKCEIADSNQNSSQKNLSQFFLSLLISNGIRQTHFDSQSWGLNFPNLNNVSQCVIPNPIQSLNLYNTFYSTPMTTIGSIPVGAFQNNYSQSLPNLFNPYSVQPLIAPIHYINPQSSIYNNCSMLSPLSPLSPYSPIIYQPNNLAYIFNACQQLGLINKINKANGGQYN